MKRSGMVYAAFSIWREEAPILMLYLDYAASSPPFAEAIQTASRVAATWFANPSAPHRLGGDAERILRKSKESIAAWFGATEEEIVLTSGGSESNNLALKGLLLHRQRKPHLITSVVEHAS